MQVSQIFKYIQHMDIYLLDQIMKGRYDKEDIILDAGCGEGRNLRWFVEMDHDIWAVDKDTERLKMAKVNYPAINDKILHGSLTKLPFDTGYFDHVVCSAVLHFAEDEYEFHKMLQELLRVLKVGGSLFIRTASSIGLQEETISLQDSFNQQRAGFYLNREIIAELLSTYQLKLLEPVKTTNVQDIRAMTTLVLQK